MVPDGSADAVGLGLFRVRSAVPASHPAAGFFVEPVGWENEVVKDVLAPLKEKGQRDRLAVHVCGENPATCGFHLPGEKVFHVGRVRKYPNASPPSYAARGPDAAGAPGGVPAGGAGAAPLDAAMNPVSHAAAAMGYAAGVPGPSGGGKASDGPKPPSFPPPAPLVQGAQARREAAAGGEAGADEGRAKQAGHKDSDPGTGSEGLGGLYQRAKKRVRKHRSRSRSRGGSRRRRGRSRDRSRSSSRSSSSPVARGPGTHMGGSRAQETARRAPGKILFEGLANMRQYLPDSAATSADGMFKPMITQYLIQVLMKSGKELGRRNERELRTLAMALDAMLMPNYLLAADTLMARFTAVEMSLTDSNWAVSQHLELIPKQSAGVASERARAQAAREESTAAKLRRSVRPASSGPSQQQGRRRSRDRGGRQE